MAKYQLKWAEVFDEIFLGHLDFQDGNMMIYTEKCPTNAWPAEKIPDMKFEPWSDWSDLGGLQMWNILPEP